MNCPICKTPGVGDQTSLNITRLFKCNSCGEFILTRDDLDDFVLQENPRKRKDLNKLSVLLRERCIQGLPRLWIRFLEAGRYRPIEEADQLSGGILSECAAISYEEFVRQWPRRVGEKLDRALGNLVMMSKTGGQEILITHDDPGLVFALNFKEAHFHIQSLFKLGRLVRADGSAAGISVEISAEGWDHFERLTQGKGSPLKPAFVAMWFGDNDTKSEMDELYFDGIVPAIKEAGYREGRADLEPHNDYIMNKIIGDIKQAPFIVADFTGHRNGVYFEAGIARGLGIPVIHTCKSSHFDKAHFDTKQLPHLRWNSPKELHTSLKEWIRGLLGEGPYPPDAEAK